MGTFFHPITLIGPTGASETLNGMVGTGAMFTVIPAPNLERLGVRPLSGRCRCVSPTAMSSNGN